jgi:hypothetical protein
MTEKIGDICVNLSALGLARGDFFKRRLLRTRYSPDFSRSSSPLLPQKVGAGAKY